VDKVSALTKVFSPGKDSQYTKIISNIAELEKIQQNDTARPQGGGSGQLL
jgi:hypothetical protein